MTEVEQQPHSNGIETIEEDDSNKVRPADIEAVRAIFLNSLDQLTFSLN